MGEAHFFNDRQNRTKKRLSCGGIGEIEVLCDLVLFLLFFSTKKSEITVLFKNEIFSKTELRSKSKISIFS